MIKNLTREILKNRVFLILLCVMTALTSFLFFFIRFSIDANMAALDRFAALSENQQNYLEALKSNTFLSTVILLALTAFTCAVFVMFYVRIVSGAKKQFGVLKALGIKNIQLQLYFAAFAAVFSLGGLLLGMLGGYFASSFPLSANARSYNVTGLVKGIHAVSCVLGLGLPLLAFALTLFACGFYFYRTENGKLLSDTKQAAGQSKLLRFADACVKKLPLKNKAPLRIALRKPLSIFLIISASTVFTVMLVLGWSLTKSSETVYKTQTEGHHYLYEATFVRPVTERSAGDALYYLAADGFVLHKGKEIAQTVFGMDANDAIYSLKDLWGVPLNAPESGACYVSAGLSEMYGIKTGDRLNVRIESASFSLAVAEVCFNAKSNTVIVNRTYLADALGQDARSFNGVLSIEPLYPNADKVINRAMREDRLSRDQVSNQASAMINQSIGIAAGAILIFLALFLTFQDSVKDILIMEHLGYRGREIKKLLIDVFLPILIVGFAITAYPSVLIARGVQTALSLQMGDYMPFSTHVLVLVTAFAAITALYWLTQALFYLGIRRVTKKKGILQYTNSL